MSRTTSFLELMKRRLNSLNCFGQSKYLAKQESYQNGNKGKVKGIYSKKTMSDYKAVAEHFSTWAKSKGYHFKSLEAVSDTHITEYLKEMQTQGKSAWSVSRDLSALNKIFDRAVTKKGADLNKRHNADIRNNRGLAQNYRQSVNVKNQELIGFISATGIRRQSVDKITPDNMIRNAEGVVIGVSVKEKGGKSRNAYVLKSKQDELTAFVDNHIREKGSVPFFGKPDKNLNTHFYRAKYAESFYNELVFAKDFREDYFGNYRDLFVNAEKMAKATSGHSPVTKGYDTEALAIVSQNLGHNRIDVIYSHYL